MIEQKAKRIHYFCRKCQRPFIIRVLGKFQTGSVCPWCRGTDVYQTNVEKEVITK